ncbi:MAG TPA: galactokinase [Tepidisphaeraceae bacterium]|jgi:galactokinase|nr:galactokinase [Tepidisphaeraceae bacterium]
MEAWIGELRAKFEGVFGAGGKTFLVRAPGRVNLIGEHTDYNDGFVCPMAIEPEVRIVCRLNESGKVRIASTVFAGQVAEFSVQEKIERGEPKWGNYMRGVAAELIGAGIPLSGMEAMYDNTLPVGGGLSSSAAIEVGTGIALLTLAGLKMDAMRLALICQKAEHEYAGVPCGIMDQMIVATGKAGHATLFDCRSMEKQFVPMDEKELRVVIVNSMVKHELSGGEYAERRKQCEEAVAYFHRENPMVKALRDVSMKQVEEAKGKLDDLVFRRARHVVGENARAVEAAGAIGRKDYERAGELMVQSHNSLRDDYEVSCEELDYLSAEAMKIKGVYGARMTGGGFGGCIVALVQPRAVEGFAAQLAKSYQGKYGIVPQVIVTRAMGGAGAI